MQKIEVPGLDDEEAKELLRSSARMEDTMMNEYLLVCEDINSSQLKEELLWS